MMILLNEDVTYHCLIIIWITIF